MQIISDYREHHINDLFKSLNIEFKTENMPIGDFKIMNGDSVKTLIERKTISDLVSSIIDGRYKEQSFRLSHLDNLHPHNIFYIIEGDLNTYKPNTRIKTESIRSAMFTLSYYKGFNVINTKTKLETANYIKFIYDKIGKQPNIEPYTQIGGGSVEKEEYVNVVKKTKRDNINKDNITILMLSQIPGISTKIAKAILNKYTFEELVIGKFDTCDITYNDTNRKIPKKSLITIKDYLVTI